LDPDRRSITIPVYPEFELAIDKDSAVTKLPFFAAECTFCDRKNQIQINLLGRKTNCIYCGQSFRAVGGDSTSAALDDPLHYWINFTAHSILEPDADLPNPYLPEPNSRTRTPR
jgi:hypothetical protein